ncbi:hypothetical protein EU244_033895 [Rhodococcus qingshengii]|uniref:hypothetical protein n=1 Tax=Rhodococcus qingshengii TaxID=334542 RepID=UPI0010A5D0EB|nr:hypothetical protein [Rhodococcus qingshengii]THJ69479.1 hypothetical protein EU244_21195 [Rhodococcus qingshengii]
MSGIDFQIDAEGIAEILNSSEVRAMVEEATGQIADQARGQVGDDIDIGVEMYTTDRPVGSVAIMHPGGIGLQLKRGILTRAAGIVGLKVGGR